jgi:multidrug efflux pump subunit AcrA (membrane-fusion protein)
MLEPDEHARFVSAGAGLAREVPVRVLRDRFTDWDDATVRVSFETLEPVSKAASDGATGWLELARRTRPTLVVPATAVVKAPEGHVVFVPTGDGRTFSRRQVVLGRALFNRVAIVAGLSDGERIVTAGAPFLEAERVSALETDGATPGPP